MGTTRTRRLLAASALALASTSCSSADTTVGYGLPHSRDAAGLDITTSPVQGTVRVTSWGCFTLDVDSPADRAADGLWILWPDDAVQDDRTVRLPDGESFTEGSRASGDGVVLTLDDLPGGADENSRLGSFGRGCGADASDVIVLRHVADA